MDDQHILKIEGSEFLCLRALTIDAQGKPVIIGGKNGHGKSSALQVVRALLGGQREVPAEPVRHGAQQAECIIKTEDYSVTRILRPDGSTKRFEVNGPDGPIKRPQEFLKTLINKTAFDPLEFARAKPGEQTKMLRDVIGIDTQEIDQEIAALEAKRTETSAVARHAAAAAESAQCDADLPSDEIPISDLVAELQTAGDKNAEIEADKKRLDTLRADVADIKRQIAELTERKTNLVSEGKALASKVKDAEPADLEAIRAKIDAAEATNAKIREASRAHDLAERATIAAKEAESAREALDAKRAERESILSSVEMPVKGLAMDCGRIMFNGAPLEQASGGEILTLSVALALEQARKAKLKIMLIDRAEELDREHLTMVLEMAAKAGVQPIIARNSTGKECTLIVRDGEARQ